MVKANCRTVWRPRAQVSGPGMPRLPWSLSRPRPCRSAHRLWPLGGTLPPFDRGSCNFGCNPAHTAARTFSNARISICRTLSREMPYRVASSSSLADGSDRNRASNMQRSRGFGRRMSEPVSDQHEQGKTNGEDISGLFAKTINSPPRSRRSPPERASMRRSQCRSPGRKLNMGSTPHAIHRHTVPQLLKKSKAWSDYCDGERPPLEAIAKQTKLERAA